MKPGVIRIIGGQWRGRKIEVPKSSAVRPTPDRVRETLFNWLAPSISGSYCLDLFAGSGVLGFEALSRGAAAVVLVDHSADIIAALKKQAAIFHASNANIYRAKVPEQLQNVKQPFDIVFIDPPYQSDLLKLSCDYLEAHGFLANPAYVYLEADHLIEDNDLPSTWHIVKKQRAGQVYYHLAYRELEEHE